LRDAEAENEQLKKELMHLRLQSGALSMQVADLKYALREAEDILHKNKFLETGFNTEQLASSANT